MIKSRQLVITLPDDIVVAIEERVELGEYKNESEVILNGLEILFDQDESPHTGDPEFEKWLHTEVMESIRESRANPNSVISSEQLRAEIASWRAAPIAEKNS